MRVLAVLDKVIHEHVIHLPLYSWLKWKLKEAIASAMSVTASLIAKNQACFKDVPPESTTCEHTLFYTDLIFKFSMMIWFQLSSIHMMHPF